MISTMDIYLIVIIVCAIVVGFFWGAARSLLLVAAWLVAFLGAAYLRLYVGGYLAQQWVHFPATFSSMAAFAVLFLLILVIATIVIVVTTRGSHRLTNNQTLDDLAGAVLAGFVAILGIAAIQVAMALFYGRPEPFVSAQGGPQWTATLYGQIIDSSIGGAIAERLVPLLGILLRPLLPFEVWEVMV